MSALTGCGTKQPFDCSDKICVLFLDAGSCIWTESGCCDGKTPVCGGNGGFQLGNFDAGGCAYERFARPGCG
jgi:uncharacterized protein (DUF779 family)